MVNLYLYFVEWPFDQNDFAYILSDNNNTTRIISMIQIKLYKTAKEDKESYKKVRS